MGQTRGQVKADVQANLQDLSINWYSDDDLNQSVQDAYDDIAILTQCIQYKVTIPWVSNLSYYNLSDNFNLGNYLGTIAVFNNQTNLWLRDDLSLKDFDRIRRDWEKWIGTPLFWAPSDFKNIAICPKYLDNGITYGAFDANSFNNSAFWVNNSANSGLGSFILCYWGTAPQLQSDGDTFLIASDKTVALTQYCTADLLEQAQEFNKANYYWGPYQANIDDYSDRVKRNCKS